MPLSEIIKLVAPPEQPAEIGTLETWRTVEQQLGVVLPSDYRDFIFTYGTGLFAQFYCIYSPFSASEDMALYASVQRTCGYDRTFQRDWPARIPYPIYPEQPGLLPWAYDENGNVYYWLTQDPPDQWKVLSYEVRGEGFREYSCTMTEYLAKVLREEIKALAGDYPRAEHRVFTPWTR